MARDTALTLAAEERMRYIVDISCGCGYILATTNEKFHFSNHSSEKSFQSPDEVKQNTLPLGFLTPKLE